ncbi:MAG: hypothetical protein KC940_15580, partial [Candidatus Omnitrophica bacterium]|nr:hypothetical protein [Candidatus Omnitrophota bacterium]
MTAPLFLWDSKPGDHTEYGTGRKWQSVDCAEVGPSNSRLPYSKFKGKPNIFGTEPLSKWGES